MQQGVTSINERRKKMNMKPIDGGDTHTIATPQVLPVSDLEKKEEGQEELEEQTEGADAEQGAQSEVSEQEETPEEAPEGDEITEENAAEVMERTRTAIGEESEKSMNFKVNRRASVEKQQKKIDDTIKTLREKGIDGTVKVSFEVPEDDDKVEKESK